MGSKRDSFYLNVHISQGKKLNKKIVIIKGEWKRDVFFFLASLQIPIIFFHYTKEKGIQHALTRQKKRE